MNVTYFDDGHCRVNIPSDGEWRVRIYDGLGSVERVGSSNVPLRPWVRLAIYGTIFTFVAFVVACASPLIAIGWIAERLGKWFGAKTVSASQRRGNELLSRIRSLKNRTLDDLGREAVQAASNIAFNRAGDRKAALWLRQIQEHAAELEKLVESSSPS